MVKLMLTACVLIAGCATGTAMQGECETQHTSFPEIYRCTYDSIAKRSPNILQDGRAKLYLLRGEQLAQEVADGRMNSLDAKVLWQQLYVELKKCQRHRELGRYGFSLALSSCVAHGPTTTSHLCQLHKYKVRKYG
jgi:hypothetical protein